MARLKREAFSEPLAISMINSDISNASLHFALPNAVNFDETQIPNIPQKEEINTNMFKKIEQKCRPMNRAPSAPILHAESSSHSMTLYEKHLFLLATDHVIRKEVALGKRIGLYTIGKELGTGNFSKVKLGVHVLAKETVAIKIIEKWKIDQRARQLFAQEINIMEKLDHPNIIRLFECIETFSRTFLILEYAGGGELHEYILKKRKLSDDEAKSLFSQIVSAISYMHSLNFVHRDIKAENIIFSRPDVLKLIDFGFSCGCPDDTMLSTSCGSPPYAAPELFRDKNYSGPMVDIWALGILLYFMLTGEMPFKGDTFNDLKLNILAGHYTFPEDVNNYARYLISAMLEMDYQKRININEITKMYWLKDNKISISYMCYNSAIGSRKSTENKIIREIFETLRYYGIDEKMIEENRTKDLRNSITGLYRITLHQALIKEYNQKLKEISEESEKRKNIANTQSKTCSIL